MYEDSQRDMKPDLILEWLSDEGFKHEIDEDGDVHFRYQGRNLYFTPDDDDTYFRIILPNIYEAEEENRYQVLEACNAITRQYKVLKAYLTPKGNLWLSIEMFVDTTPDIGDFFERCCNILVHGYEDMKKEIFGE